jgi:hypothetical protein
MKKVPIFLSVQTAWWGQSYLEKNEESIILLSKTKKLSSNLHKDGFIASSCFTLQSFANRLGMFQLSNFI